MSPYAVRMEENNDQNNSEYGRLSENYSLCVVRESFRVSVCVSFQAFNINRSIELLDQESQSVSLTFELLQY